MAVPCSSSSSVRFLQLELKKLQEEPAKDFECDLSTTRIFLFGKLQFLDHPKPFTKGDTTRWNFCFRFCFLCEYRRMNIMYCNNCYPPLPVVNMFYAAEDMTILLALKQTMMFVILLLFCYTRTCTDCLFFAFSLLFHILCKLRLTTF